MYFHAIALLAVILLLFTFPVYSNNYAVYGKKDKSASNSTASSSQDNNKFVLKADKGDNTKPLKGVKIQNNEQPSSSDTSNQGSNAQKGSSSQTSNAEKTTATNVPSDCKKEVNKAFTVNPPYGEGYSVGCSVGYKDGKNGNPCSNAVPTNPYNENDDSFSNVNWESGYSNGYSQGHNIAVNGDPNVDSCSKQSSIASNAENHPFTQLLGTGTKSNNNKPGTDESQFRTSVTKDRFDGTTTIISTDMKTGASRETIYSPDGTKMELDKDKLGNIIQNRTEGPVGGFIETVRHANGTISSRTIMAKGWFNYTSYTSDGRTDISDNPDGIRISDVFDRNGIIKSREIRYPGGMVTTWKSDGSTTTDNPDGTWFITFPKKSDGSFETYYPNGTTFLHKPDGTIKLVTQQ